MGRPGAGSAGRRPIPPSPAAIVLYSHGSPDPRWRGPFDQLAAEVLAADPARAVRLAFLERMEPSLEAALEELIGLGVRTIRIVPIFLAPGRHTRVDLPAQIDRLRLRWPDRTLVYEPTLLESATVRAAIVRGLDAADAPARPGR